MSENEQAVVDRAAKRYAELTIELGPRHSGPNAVWKYRPVFASLPVDNPIRQRYVDAARDELAAETGARR